MPCHHYYVYTKYVQYVELEWNHAGRAMLVFTSDMLLMGYSYTLGMRLWCVGDGWGGAGM